VIAIVRFRRSRRVGFGDRDRVNSALKKAHQPAYYEGFDGEHQTAMTPEEVKQACADAWNEWLAGGS
jgi:hypothetical protein